MSKKFSRENLPFVWGAQYYRAPTPEPNYWQADLAKAAAIGMKDLKFWAQWRVSSQVEGEYYFDDLDRLMDLAGERDFRVTINVIYDGLPQWVQRKWPDCLMLLPSGQPVTPYAGAARQTGGWPGPCLNHPGAREARQDFARVCVERYREHPAMFMWDMWNEPEQCAPHRSPDEKTLTCYCPVCQGLFKEWLADRYGDIERLNQVWGRYYHSFEDIETPISVRCLTNMVDWRLFMLDTVTGESAWRVQLARELDPNHAVYTHVVPTIGQAGWGFNQITCVDDFALADQVDIFAGTVNRIPVMPVKVTSAAAGKVCYNVESHLNSGNTSYHPRPLTLEKLKKEFLMQIGCGIRGFMFWQLHAETIGLESPAWGLLDTGGNPRAAYHSAGKFYEVVGPHFDALMSAPPPQPKVGVLFTAANEIFQWCMGRMGDFGKDVVGWTELLFWNSLPVRYVPASRISDEGLADLEALIVPEAYCMMQAEADAILRWVRAGGLLVTESHLAGYNFTTGRHAGPLPGAGFAEALGVREIEASGDSPETERVCNDQPAEGMQQDVIVAAGGKFRPEHTSIVLADGTASVGYKRQAGLDAPDAEVLARFRNGMPVLVSKSVGEGGVIYGGTNFGQVVMNDGAAVGKLLAERIAARTAAPAGATVTGDGLAHLDVIEPAEGAKMYVVIGEGEAAEITWSADTSLRGAFSGIQLTPTDGKVTCQTQGEYAELFTPVE